MYRILCSRAPGIMNSGLDTAIDWSPLATLTRHADARVRWLAKQCIHATLQPSGGDDSELAESDGTDKVSATMDLFLP